MPLGRNTFWYASYTLLFPSSTEMRTFLVPDILPPMMSLTDTNLNPSFFSCVICEFSSSMVKQ